MKNTYSIESMIEEIGWGSYHNKLFVNCMGGWLIGAMWFAACTLITPQLEISSFHKTLLWAGVNLGGLLGSFLFSYLSDLYGKVLVFKRIILLTLFGAALLMVSVCYEMTLLAMILIGMGAGGDISIPANVILDFIPRGFKGRIA